MRYSTIVCGAICGLFLADAGATALHLPTPLSIQTAEAQQMGKQPWSPDQRNRSLSAQFQHSDRQLRQSNGVNSGSMGALQQFVETYNHTYNSSSTSIGNLNEISQILSGGSIGAVHQATDQDSQGNQGSAANTEVAVDSETNSTSSAATNTGSGAGGN